MFGLGLGLNIGRPALSGGSLTAQVQALFAGGKVGGMWDMGDTSTLFQDYATPVTAVTQPIGMVLDKSQGLVLGPELVTNGDFSSGGTGWTVGAGVSISSGAANFGPAASINLHSNGGGYVTGKTYQVTFTVSALTSGSVSPWIRGVFGPAVASNGTFSSYVVAGSGADLFILSGAGCTATVDNVSVKLIPGNHATQSTAGSRPLYQVVGGYGCAQFDGINDYLSCGSVDFSATDKVTVVAAMTLASSGNYGLVGHGNNSAGNFNVGFFTFCASWRASLVGSTGNAQTRINPAALPAAPHTRVLTVEFDLAGAASTDEAKFRLNGATVIIDDVAGVPAGGGNLANATLEIGRCQGTFVFNGNVHRLVVIGGGLSAAERRIVETYAAEGNGQTIP